MTAHSIAISDGVEIRSTSRGATVFFGRLLYGVLFVFAGLGHFAPATISFAASQGVPLASLAVPASGILAIIGGLSIIFGYRAKFGAWLLILFLVPVTVMMHNFWAAADPATAQLQLAMFLKNVALIGGALFISQVGAGPFSLDAYSGR